MLDTLPKLAGLFGLAFWSFFWSFPAGAALHLNPLVIGFVAWLAYLLNVVIVLFIGKPVRDWLMRRFGHRLNGNPNSLIPRTWDRYGLIGLSLLAPVTIGALLGALLGVTLGVPSRKLAVGLMLGAALWAVLATVAVALGLKTLGA